MGTLIETVSKWSDLTFDQNPYGDPIPEKYLHDMRVMRNINGMTNVKPLSGRKQNGYILNFLFNDQSKKSDAEDEETISFSDIFHRLEKSEALCPSNFLVEVINDLRKWDTEHFIAHDDDFYCKTIARALRAFASMLREQNLREITNKILKIEAIRRRNTYQMFEASAEEDMKQKTDIAFRYAGVHYRVWSYQTTQSGIKKTSRRILRCAGKGKNLLMPFDITTANMVNGWAFYDEESVRDILLQNIVNNKCKVQSYWAYRKLVKEDPNIIKEPTVFYA